MYFTEVDECPEDPIALKEAFEAEYDSDEYEAKVSKLRNSCITHISESGKKMPKHAIAGEKP